jgi:hypothetical protein
LVYLCQYGNSEHRVLASSSSSDSDEQQEITQLLTWNLMQTPLGVGEMDPILSTKLGYWMNTLTTNDYVMHVAQFLDNSLHNDIFAKDETFSSVGYLTYIIQQCPTKKERIVNSLLQWVPKSVPSEKSKRGYLIALLYLAYLKELNISIESEDVTTINAIKESFSNPYDESSFHYILYISLAKWDTNAHYFLVIICELLNLLLVTVGDDEFSTYFDEFLLIADPNTQALSKTVYSSLCTNVKVFDMFEDIYPYL